MGESASASAAAAAVVLAAAAASLFAPFATATTISAPAATGADVADCRWGRGVMQQPLLRRSWRRAAVVETRGSGGGDGGRGLPQGSVCVFTKGEKGWGPRSPIYTHRARCQNRPLTLGSTTIMAPHVGEEYSSKSR